MASPMTAEQLRELIESAENLCGLLPPVGSPHLATFFAEPALTRCRAAVEAARLSGMAAATAWQSIDTAPKDRRILLAGHGWQAVGWWSAEEGAQWDESTGGTINGGQWIDGSVHSWGSEEYAWLAPTHWRELPAAPEVPWSK